MALMKLIEDLAPYGKIVQLNTDGVYTLIKKNIKYANGQTLTEKEIFARIDSVVKN
ncbi:hypothetical protein FACS1894166_10110 [Bacilli bacterium]|nr:hypothetical protein FACS1894166_10110 [Bacilli bacterium]